MRFNNIDFSKIYLWIAEHLKNLFGFESPGFGNPLSKFLLSFLFIGFVFYSCSTEEIPPTYTLNTSVKPENAGLLIVSPSSSFYQAGEVVTITPQPREGWIFEKWEGDANGNANPLRITMNSNQSLAGLFIKKDYPLNITIVGEGTVEERIVASPSGKQYPFETVVELTPIPKEGWIFDRFEGDLTGNESPQNLAVTGEKNVTVIFKRRDYPLNITIVGEGTVEERIVSSPSGRQNDWLPKSFKLNITEPISTNTFQRQYPFGSVLELIPVPKEGWIFDGFEGDLVGNQYPQNITINSEKNVVLRFSKEEPKLLPNPNVENGISYYLQSSDVYIEPNQLLKDFERSYTIAYSDFNNDGATDILLSGSIFKSYEYSPMYLLKGDGSAVNPNFCECGGECTQFTCSSFEMIQLPFEGMQHPRKILVGDYNNDGLPDAFILGHGYDAPPFPGEAPIVLLNNGNGFTYQKLSSYIKFYHGGASGDYDHDGDLDIMFTPGGKPGFFKNDGRGQFTITDEFLDVSFQNRPYYTGEALDINKDGYLDLLIGGHEYEGASTVILWGNSSGKYTMNLSTFLPPIQKYGIVVDIDGADIDGDGDIDLVLNRVDSDNFYENYYIQILENIGNQTFVDVTSTSISNNSGANWFVWIHMQDLNNDNILDIYLQTDHFKNKKFIGDGRGNFRIID